MSDTEPRIKKIAEDSDRFRRHIEKNRTNAQSSIFGEEELIRIDSLRQLGGKSREVDDIFNSLRKSMFILSKKDSKALVLISMLSGVDGRFFSESEDEPRKAFFDRNVLSDEKLEDLLKKRIDQLRLRNQAFEETLPELFLDFKNKFSKVREKYGLEGIINDESLDKRFTEVRARLEVDSLTSNIPENTVGTYASDLDDFLMQGSIVFNPRFNHIFFHEMLHALSGKTITETKGKPGFVEVVKRKFGFQSKERYKTDIQRVGTQIAGRFHWLNEAITSNLAKLMLPEDTFDDSDFSNLEYPDERKLLSLLTRSGRRQIPEGLFVRAYFERYNTKSDGEKLPEWKSLIKAVNLAYEPGFLVKIDNIVTKGGIKKASEFITTNYS